MRESSYVIRVETRKANRGRKTSSRMARSSARDRFTNLPRAGISTVRGSGWAMLGLLAAVVFLAHLPLIRDPIDVRPDGAEYLGIARHFAWEGRWESDIKWHFTTNEPVRHRALGDRPPLYPLVAGAAVRLSPDPAAQVYAARLLNAAIAAVAALLAWFLFAAEFGAPTAWISVLIFSFLPQTLRYGSQPLTEMLLLALLVGALLAWRTAEGRKSLAWSAATGFLAGLAALTHPSGIVLLAVLFVTGWLPPR